MSSQRGLKVIGARTPAIWLAVAVILLALVALAVGGLMLLPARETERHYQAGVTFQNLGDWVAAESEYKQVIAHSAGYKDTQGRLVEVKDRLAQATATAQAQVQATAIAQTQATAQAQADAAATAAAIPTATAAALEVHYQRALGLINLQQWVEAQAELRTVFDIDPNYKDVQTRFALVSAQLTALAPTATIIPSATSSPVKSPTPEVTPTLLRPIELFSDSSWKSSTQEFPDWATSSYDDSWWSTAEQLEFGKAASIINMDKRAKWIWHPGGQSIMSPIFFRKKIELERRPSVAAVTISADDYYDLYVNGTHIGADGGWHNYEVAEKYNVAPYLVEGENVIAVQGVNTQQGAWLLVWLFIGY